MQREYHYRELRLPRSKLRLHRNKPMIKGKITKRKRREKEVAAHHLAKALIMRKRRII